MTSAASIEPDFGDNRNQINRIVELLQSPDVEVVGVTIKGTSSLEGTNEANAALALKRRKAVEDLIRSYSSLPDSLFKHDLAHFDWEGLREAISDSDLPNKERIISIIDGDEQLIKYYGNYTIDKRIHTLRWLDGGKTWDVLNSRFFPAMRKASADITFTLVALPAPEPVQLPSPEPVEEPVMEEEVVVEEVIQQVVPAEEYLPLFSHIKTNALGWGMAMVNAAIEFDFARHWSVTLPVYYSAWDYFTYSLKFRTLSIQPEVRYWLSRRNEGLFFGAHANLAWYNFAFKGDYRYQDHNRRTPCLGGGLGLGYRMPISKNGRWHVEFAASAGAYRLYYDKFLNVPNGRLVGSERRTYIGLDAVAVTFSYRFTLEKGGRK